MALEKIDWSQCPLVDVKTDPPSGTPARHGSTIDSIDGLAGQFGVSSDHVDAIVSLVAYAHNPTTSAATPINEPNGSSYSDGSRFVALMYP